MPAYKVRTLSYLLFVLIVLFLIAIPFFSTNRTGKVDFSRTQFLMGTLIEIRVKGEDRRILSEAVDSAFQEIKRLEDLMSHYSEESEITELARKAGKDWVKVSPEVLDVIEDSIAVSKLSRGSFDITIGALGGVWSFGEGRERIPERSEIEAPLPLVDYNNLFVDRENRKVKLGREGMRITLGGIGKGYSVEKAMEVLKGYGIKEAIINAGGDLKVTKEGGENGWRVGIQDPRNPEEIIATLEVFNTSMATSGDYQRYFIKDGVRYHHILDPRTGFPAKGTQSVTIVTGDTGFADALATAVFVLGPKEGMALIDSLLDVEGLVVDDHGEISVSKGLEGKVKFHRN